MKPPPLPRTVRRPSLVKQGVGAMLVGLSIIFVATHDAWPDASSGYVSGTGVLLMIVGWVAVIVGCLRG